MREDVLFEYDASIDIGDSDLSVRLALNDTVTAVCETTISFEAGKEELSAGRADAKFQSSSVFVDGPLLCWTSVGVEGTGALGEAKLNIDADGAGDGCWGGFEASAAKGSVEEG